jgi:N-formylglutamate deformylase
MEYRQTVTKTVTPLGASELPYDIVEPKNAEAEVPVLVGAPHAGYRLPHFFPHDLDLFELARTVDHGSDQFASESPNFGMPLITGKIIRCLVDPARRYDDLDTTLIEGVWPEPVRPSPQGSLLGTGIIARLHEQTGQIYYKSPLSQEEVRHRLAYWTQHHRALDSRLQGLKAKFGGAILLDVHTCSGHASPYMRGVQTKRPAITLSNRDGTSCTKATIDLLVKAFKDAGIDPSVNYPFKGGYITERYGTGQVQAVQCEINKALFESEETLEIHADGFARIKDVMNVVLRQLAENATTLVDLANRESW